MPPRDRGRAKGGCTITDATGAAATGLATTTGAAAAGLATGLVGAAAAATDFTTATADFGATTGSGSAVRDSHRRRLSAAFFLGPAHSGQSFTTPRGSPDIAQLSPLPTSG